MTDVGAKPAAEFLHVFSYPDHSVAVTGRRVAGAPTAVICSVLGSLAPGAAEALTADLASQLQGAGWIGDQSRGWGLGEARLALDEFPVPQLELSIVRVSSWCGPVDQGLVGAHLAKLHATLPSTLNPRAAAPSEPTPVEIEPKTITVAELAASLRAAPDSPIILLLGAGASEESGVPTFAGARGLEERLAIAQPLATGLVQVLIDDPRSVFEAWTSFEAAIKTSNPGALHEAVRGMVEKGWIDVVVTTNFDHLLEAARVPKAIRWQPELANRLREPLLSAFPTTGTLIVVGASRDETALIDVATRSGWNVLSVNPERSPLVRAPIGWIQARATEALCCLEPLLPRRPAVPLGEVLAPDTWASLRRRFDGAVARRSGVHGDGHARSVAWIGLHLAEHLSTADRGLLVCFALLHDAFRENDENDPDHGAVASEIAVALAGRALSPRQLEVLRKACRDHSLGVLSRDPTVGLCWDADRLDLWRVGVAPDPRRLSTAVARVSVDLFRGVYRNPPPWDQILARARRSLSD